MPLDYPSQSYFPGSKVTLVVRFDEFGKSELVAQKVPAKTTKNLNGIDDDRNNLSVVSDPDAPQGVKRFLLGSSGKPAQAQADSDDDYTHVLGGVIPTDAEWSQNGIRTADTLKVTLRYVDCPIDPRTIRSCAIEFFLGCVKEEDFAAGVGGASDVGNATFNPGTASFDGARPLNLIPDDYTDDAGNPRTNLRFQGWVDKWTVEWKDDGEPSIVLDCRDNTQLLIDQHTPPRLTVAPTLPIDQAVANYLAHFPSLQGMTVEYQPQGDAIPQLDASLARTAFRPKLGPQPKKGAGTDKHSIWDYLTDVCGQIGHAIYVQGTRVVIQRVRSLMTNQKSGRPDDPFTGRTLPSGTSFNFRRFIYGRNVAEMHFSRNYSKKVPTNVELRSYSAETKSVIVARFPLPADRIAYALPGDAQPDQKWIVRKVSGVKDEKSLRALAQEVYESLGRSELEAELKTKNLASFGGGNTDPDILDARFGDTVEVLVNREEEEFSTITSVESYLTAQDRNSQYLAKLGFSDAFAAAYARAYTDAGFQTTFRVRKMKVTWGVDEGVDITLSLVNYLEVRADKFLPQGEEPNDTVDAPRPPQNSGPTSGPPPDLPSPF